MRLCWSHIPRYRKSHVAAHMSSDPDRGRHNNNKVITLVLKNGPVYGWGQCCTNTVSSYDSICIALAYTIIFLKPGSFSKSIFLKLNFAHYHFVSHRDYYCLIHKILIRPLVKVLYSKIHHVVYIRVCFEENISWFRRLCFSSRQVCEINR